jgi:hypothetical protein
MHGTLKNVAFVVRLLLGALFFVMGILYFLGVLPNSEVPTDAGAFLGALAATSYMFPLVKLIELAAGALLIANRFVPLALVLLAPVLVNILLFHLVLAPRGLVIGLAAVAAELFLAWEYRDAYAPLLRARHEPKDARTSLRRVPAHA